MTESAITGTKLVKVVEEQGGRGRGLVAAAAIPAGVELVEYSRRFISKLDPKYPTASNTAADYLYRFDTDAGYYLADPHAAGYLVNDACDPAVIARLAKATTVQDIAAWTALYTKCYVRGNALSACRPNAALTEVPAPDGKMRLAVLSIAPLKEGEPILTAYGVDYWPLALGLDEKAPPRARMAVVAWCMQGEVFPAVGTINGIEWLPSPAASSSAAASLPEFTVMAMADGEDEKRRLLDAVDSTLDATCDRWLAAVGLPAGGYAKWIEACDAAGYFEARPARSLEEIVFSALNSEEVHKPEGGGVTGEPRTSAESDGDERLAGQVISMIEQLLD